MCDAVKVNYHLVFFLLTSDSQALCFTSDSTYAEEPILVKSCQVFVLKNYTGVWQIHSINRRWGMDVFLYIRWPSWSMLICVCVFVCVCVCVCVYVCVFVSEWVFMNTWSPRAAYIKPEGKHWSKGQVTTVPARLFYLSLREGCAAEDHSASLQLTVVHFNPSTQFLTAPQEGSIVSCRPWSELMGFMHCSHTIVTYIGKINSRFYSHSNVCIGNVCVH